MTERQRGLRARNAAGEPLVTAAVVDGGVLVITLNRAERANAWREEVEFQYEAAFESAVADDDARVIVLTGAGTSFCPGMDLERLEEITTGGRPYMADRGPQTFLREVPKPVIAAVNGACAGIGFVQAMMADFRFTAREARWSAAFSRIGLVAEDGVAARVQQLAGDEVAADVLLSGRVFDGDEAVRLGLAREAVPRGEVLGAAIEYGRVLARCSPASLALIKRQLVLDSGSSLEASRRRAVAYLERAKELPDYAEGVRALGEKRPPVFGPLHIDSIWKV